MMKRVWEAIRKDLWIVVLDIIAVNASYFLALVIRFFVNGSFRPVVENAYMPAFRTFAPFYTVLCLTVFILFRLYGGMWSYAGLNDMNRIIGACACTTVIQVVGTYLFVRRMPISYYVIGSVLQFVFMSLTRFGYRFLQVERQKIGNRNAGNIPALVIGTGEWARKAVHHLESTPFKVAAIVDEKSAGQSLDGVPVVKEMDLKSIQTVFIADPGLSAEKRKDIKEKCDAAGIELQDFTGFFRNMGGRIPVASLLELNQGPVTLVVDGKEQKFASGSEAIASLSERYDVVSIEGARITLTKPSAAGAYAGFESWAQEHKEKTGEDISFF